MRISDWSSDVCSSDLSRRSSLCGRCLFCRSSRRLDSFWARAHGAEFDLLVIGRAENQAFHIDAGQVDRVGVEAADGDDFLDIGDADLRGGRHLLVEVTPGLYRTRVV